MSKQQVNLTDKERQQIERVVKGEIGSANLNVKEAVIMIQTMENRRMNPEIKASYDDHNSYKTLNNPADDFKLNPQQQKIMNEAFEKARTEKNLGYLEWNRSKDGLISSKVYDFKPVEKIGDHFYFTGELKHKQ